MSEYNARDQLTLIEIAKRTLDGQHLAVAEVLNETNEVLQDAVWLESNQPTSHVTSKRVSLPNGTWRKINSGVSREASTTKQITETIGLCEAYSVVDKFLVDIAPNPREFRSQEDLAFVEGLSQTLSDVLFKSNAGTIYGDISANPERFNGFPVRYNSVSGYDNVRDEGGSGNDTTSLWVVQWGPSMVHMVYPKATKAGIEMRDLGEQTVSASDSPSSSPSEYQAYRTHFKFSAGLVVRDDRCVQRLASIEPTAGSDSSGSLDEDNIIRMLNDLPYQGRGAVIYCNKTLKATLDILAKDSGNLAVTSVLDTFGAPVTNFWGVPVRRVDAILNTETAL